MNGDGIKETFLPMKGWEKMWGSVCIACDREVAAYGAVRIKLDYNWLNMITAPHWPMCTEHAFTAQVGFDNGIWYQTSYYDGRSW